MKNVFIAILAVFVSVAGVLGVYVIQRQVDRHRSTAEARETYKEILQRVDQVGTLVQGFATEFGASSKQDADLNAAAFPLAADPDFLWAEWLSRVTNPQGVTQYVVRKVSRTGNQDFVGRKRQLTGAIENATNPAVFKNAGDMKRVFLSNPLSLRENDEHDVFAAVHPLYDEEYNVTGLAVAYFSSVLQPLKNESTVSMEIHRLGRGDGEDEVVVRAGGLGRVGPLLSIVTERGPERYRFIMKERNSQAVRRAKMALFGLLLWPIAVFAAGSRYWKKEARRFRSQCFDLNNEISERQEMQETLQSLLALREQERKTVSSDIHDGFVQEVVSARMFLEALSSRIDVSDQQAQRHLSQLKQTIQQAISEGRRLVNRNQVLAVDELGFLPALHRLIASQQEKFDLTVTLRYADQLPELDVLQQRCIYRVIQEALTNVRRHSEAKEASVSILLQDDQVCAKISDHGKGFDLDAIRRSSYGIQSMTQRVEVLGGELSIASELGGGTQVSAWLPISYTPPYNKFVKPTDGTKFAASGNLNQMGSQANHAKQTNSSTT